MFKKISLVLTYLLLWICGQMLGEVLNKRLNNLQEKIDLIKRRKGLLKQYFILHRVFFHYFIKMYNDYFYDYILLTLFTLTKSHHLRSVTYRPELQ